MDIEKKKIKIKAKRRRATTHFIYNSYQFVIVVAVDSRGYAIIIIGANRTKLGGEGGGGQSSSKQEQMSVTTRQSQEESWRFEHANVRVLTIESLPPLFS